MELADNLASLAQQGAWVLWLARFAVEPISEPTRDPERVRQDWHFNCLIAASSHTSRRRQGVQTTSAARSSTTARR